MATNFPTMLFDRVKGRDLLHKILLKLPFHHYILRDPPFSICLLGSYTTYVMPLIMFHILHGMVENNTIEVVPQYPIKDYLADPPGVSRGLESH